MANRVKKEEKKRGKPFPSGPIGEEEWKKLMIYYEDTTLDERLQESLAPVIREMEEKIKKVKNEKK